MQSVSNQKLNMQIKQSGSTLIYAMAIVALFLIAYAVYFFATLKPANPYELKSEYERLYLEDAAEVNQSDFRYETDLYQQFGNRISDESGATGGGVPNNTVRTIGEPIPGEQVQESAIGGVVVGTTGNPRPSEGVAQQNSTDSNIVSREAGNSVVSPIENTNPSLALSEVYTSKNNSRITFPIPANTKVKETKSANPENTSGSASPIITFTFNVDDKDVSMTVVKISQGCFNPLIAFAIPTGLGVDYRILYTQKEIDLSNTYRATIGLEEYGTYSGLAGYRGTSCIQSPVPTKIDIRTAGWKKGEQQAVLKFIEEILSKMTV